jgi:acetylserotonin N-methyltransferase
MKTYEAPAVDDRRIWDLWISGTYQGAIVGSIDAGIFDALAEKPDSIRGLATRLDFDERATGVALRLLAALGLLSVHQEVFQLSELARIYLVKSSPFFWGPTLNVAVSAWHRDTLLAKLKQKGSATAAGPEGKPRISGEGRAIDGWASGQVSLEDARRTAAVMHAHSLPAAIVAAREYDFKGVHRILDIGGGSGCFMIAMAQAHPHLHCTIMDLPAMCEVAQGYIRSGGVSDRVDTIAVDMFRHDWPAGYDAVFFSNVWHDWNFRTCKWLGERAFEILPSGGRIILHEMLLNDDGAGPSPAAAFSLLMLLATQGQQFTFAELKGILESAKFSDVQTKQGSGYYSLVSGFKH